MIEIKVYTLTCKDAAAKRIGTMKGELEKSLANLRVRLEEKQVLDFQFQ